MAKEIDVPGEVNALVQRLTAAAADEHEALAMIRVAGLALSQKHAEAELTAENAQCHLVLEKRATATGVSVTDQLNAAGALLKKRPENVTPAEALRVVVFTDVVPDPNSTPKP